MQLIELRIDQIPAYMQEMQEAVEFFNAHHPDPNDFDLREVNPMGGDGFFRFEKILKSS